ncbi:hypothetical protein HDV04_002871 [Boothiomyces sp. JEL0838]|nr:hypothetical protein HDV04_002871 [Boothiomyces sp. JEL0838]
MTLWPLIVYNSLVDSKVIDPFLPELTLNVLNAIFGNVEEFFQASSLLLSFGISAITYYIVCWGGNTMNINMKYIFIAIFATASVYAIIRFGWEVRAVIYDRFVGIYSRNDGNNLVLDFLFVWCSTIPLAFCFFASYLQLRKQISQRMASSSRAQGAIHNIMVKLIQSLNISNLIIWTPLMAFSLLLVYCKLSETSLPAVLGPLIFLVRLTAGARGFIHYIVLYVLFKDTQIYDFEFTPVEASPLLPEDDQRSFIASARYGGVNRATAVDNSGILGNNLGLFSENQPVEISSSLSLGNSFTLGASP